MNLVIDVGNTYTKLAVFQQDGLEEKYQAENQGAKKGILEMLSRYSQIKAAIVSNVTTSTVPIPREVQHKVRILDLSPSTHLPFENLYATPQTLGNDRKALVSAAAKFYPDRNVLVIDAGTCITYDIKNSRNQYLGGAISPGLEMRFRSLNQFTAKLPLGTKEDDFNLTGDSTLSSISAGVHYGVIKEVDGFIDEYAAEYDNLLIIVTGGDAQFLSINLKNTIFANSNFLLEGLNYILETNTSQ